MFTFLLILLILDAILLTVVVLLQAGQGGGLASLGGGASTDSFLGGRQAVTILTKLSWWCGGIFLGLSLLLAGFGTRGSAPRSVLEQQAPAPAPAAPPPLQEQPPPPPPAGPAPPGTPAPGSAMGACPSRSPVSSYSKTARGSRERRAVRFRPPPARWCSPPTSRGTRRSSPTRPIWA